MEHFQEEIIVLFHAAFIGRADVAQVSAYNIAFIIITVDCMQ
jgi:hypothetical protein